MADDFTRDRWDRPLIVPVEGGKAVPYVRASKLPDLLKNSDQLTKWKIRKAAEGLLYRPDLMTRIAGVLANGKPDDKRVKGALNAICADAIEAAKASSGSNTGTGLPELTEAVDRGESPFVPNPNDQCRLDLYREALLGSGYEPLGWEVRVVNDDLRAAGTFDRLWRCPDGAIRVGDLKTGKWDALYPLGVTTQVATYANGVCYDVDTDTRSPIHPDLDTEVGLLVHLTENDCQVIPLDLRRGKQAAAVASLLYWDITKWKAADLVLPAEGATLAHNTEEGEAE